MTKEEIIKELPKMKGKELEATIRDWLLYLVNTEYGTGESYEKTARAIIKIK